MRPNDHPGERKRAPLTTPRPCIVCGVLTRLTFGAVYFDRGVAIGAHVCCDCSVGPWFLTRAERALRRRLDELGVKLATFEPCEPPDLFRPPWESEPC